MSTRTNIGMSVEGTCTHEGQKRSVYADTQWN